MVNQLQTYKKVFYSCILFLFFSSVFFLYLHNITQDIYSGDIGDLVTASYVFGVPHPPGYPLFTFLGFLFSHIPFSFPVVSRVALISFLSSWLGLIVLYKFAKKVSNDIFISLLATSILAFSYLYWLHAEVPEAFGLNNFFVIALFYISYLFYKEKKVWQFYLLCFCMGLSLTHHQTILFIFPGLFLLLLKNLKYVFKKKKRILLAFLSFIVGFFPYLYVLIAASHNPIINWDNAYNFQNLIHLILRKDYGFAPAIVNEVPFAVKIIQVKSYFESLIIFYSYQVLFLALLGVIKLIKIDRLLFVSLFISFLFSGPAYIFYGANITTEAAGMGIIERFYLISAIILMFFVIYGLVFVKELLNHILSKKIYTFILLSYFLIIPFFLVKYNFEKTNLSQSHIGNNLAIDILSSLPKNAVIFVSGDTTSFNIWYVHYVLGFRPDVNIINPPGVGGNIYFDNQINRYHKLHPSIKLTNLVAQTLEDIRKRHSVYTTYEISSIPKHTILLPKGLIYEMTYDNAMPTKQEYIRSVEPVLNTIHRVRSQTLLPYDDNLIASEIPMIYSNALVRVGDFLFSYYHDSATPEHYYRRALWFDDKNPAAYAGLSLSQYKAYNDCPNSIENMNSAIDIYPIWKTYYLQLYLLYKRCNTSQKIVNKYKERYYSLFKISIDTDLTNSTKRKI